MEQYPQWLREARESDDRAVRLRAGVRLFYGRRTRDKSFGPWGSFVEGIWSPSAVELRPCCERIRVAPMGEKGYSQQLDAHCRTTTHIAALLDLPKKELANAVKSADDGERQMIQSFKDAKTRLVEARRALGALLLKVRSLETRDGSSASERNEALTLNTAIDQASLKLRTAITEFELASDLLHSSKVTTGLLEELRSDRPYADAE